MPAVSLLPPQMHSTDASVDQLAQALGRHTEGLMSGSALCAIITGQHGSGHVEVCVRAHPLINWGGGGRAAARCCGESVAAAGGAGG